MRSAFLFLLYIQTIAAQAAEGTVWVFTADRLPPLQHVDRADRLYVLDHPPVRNGAGMVEICAMLGKTPLFGLMTDEGRMAKWLVEVKTSKEPDWGAIGTAIGRNPVSWLIPCHRVINSLGGLGGYRWGTNTKQAMIGYEAALSSHPDNG